MCLNSSHKFRRAEDDSLLYSNKLLTMHLLSKCQAAKLFASIKKETKSIMLIEHIEKVKKYTNTLKKFKKYTSMTYTMIDYSLKERIASCIYIPTSHPAYIPTLREEKCIFSYLLGRTIKGSIVSTTILYVRSIQHHSLSDIFRPTTDHECICKVKHWGGGLSSYNT